MLEKLTGSLRQTLVKIQQSLFVDKALVDELCKEIQRALLQSDVNVRLVFDLTNRIKQKALGETPKGLNKKDYLIKVVYDELVIFLGGEGHKISITAKPFKIMLLGLFGSGKTTTAGKLARFFSTRGHRIVIVGLDVHRPGAMEQILQIAEKIKVNALVDKNEKDAIKILKKFEPEFHKYDVLIFDTAGRDALSDDLIEEINSIYSIVKPQENLLVMSADIGQAADKQARVFHDACAITGVIITKMEGTARGGGALSACAVTHAPVKFIGVGEKLEDFETFEPKRFVGRMLGMGDIETLLEKAQEVMTEEDAEDLGKKFLKGDYNLIDLYEQMEAMSKMGPLNKIVEMIPGFSQLHLPKEMLAVQEGKLKFWKYAMNSMSREELEEPDIITGDRIDRIAKGAGLDSSTVRELVKQYRQSKKLVKMLKGFGAGNPKQMEKVMKRLNIGM